MLNSISTPLPLLATPMEVALGLRHLPGLVFFDSARGESGQISIVAAAPTRTLRSWEELQVQLAARTVDGEVLAPDGPAGMAAGYVDYDGALQFGIYEEVLLYRHDEGRWYERGALSRQLKLPARCGHARSPEFVPAIDRETYCAMVERAREYIAAGDIYQVNLSQRFSADWEGDPFAFYSALRECSPAPYAVLMQLGGRTVLSSSPESFLQMVGRQICTRPIKGTSPRRPDNAADERSAMELVSSPKEIAELVMITDLERNDLGQICEFGSVRVSELLKLERFQQVFHLVSKVEGVLRPDVDHVAALRACFPGGSITGAPKRRAREIIAELEPSARGLYTGALGYFGFDGQSQFNIAIRTVVIEGARAHFHVGAGIVADSVPANEYDETLHKAAGILLAAKSLAVD